MRKMKLVIAAIIATFPFAVSADVIEVSDVTIDGTSYGAFVDDTTGLTWLDLDNFWGPTDTYNTVFASLVGSGFHLATEAEMLGLHASIGVVGTGAVWTAMATIVGGNYIGNPDEGADRELLWGIYDDGDENPNTSTSYQYSSTGWLYESNIRGPDVVLETANPSNRDLGAWVVSDAVQVPEPGTLVLFGIGLLGMAASRKRKKA